jgi:hypothetical protein
MRFQTPLHFLTSARPLAPLAEHRVEPLKDAQRRDCQNCNKTSFFVGFLPPPLNHQNPHHLLNLS